MPVIQRKRRGPAQDESDSDTPQAGPSRSTQRRRQSPEPGSEGDGYEESATQADSISEEQLARKLVRYALACEHARMPIRRVDINAKVFTQGRARKFNAVFEQAQLQLESVFGMKMVEQPPKDKVTVQERRAAMKKQSTSTSTNAWYLVSTLPEKFKDPDIIPPPKVPTKDSESAYVGLYTFVVALIYLAGGQLAEAKLDRYLRRTNTDQSTPLDKTEKVLSRMIREGYIVKIRDSSTGEEVIDYMVGQRGKIEVGERGVEGLVRTVYGDAVDEELVKRIERSVGLNERATATAPTTQQNGAAPARQPRGRPPRATQREQTEEWSSEDDE